MRGGAWRDRRYMVKPPPLWRMDERMRVSRVDEQSLLVAYVAGIIVGALFGALTLYLLLPYLPYTR
jgi:hypothetical protein